MVPSDREHRVGQRFQWHRGHPGTGCNYKKNLWQMGRRKPSCIKVSKWHLSIAFGKYYSTREALRKHQKFMADGYGIVLF